MALFAKVPFSGGVVAGAICVGDPLGAIVDVAFFALVVVVDDALAVVDVALALFANDGPTAPC